MPQPLFYGGQAVIEGVLMRGSTHMAVAVRRPSGEIAVKVQPAGFWAATRLRRLPLLRGVLVLAETLVQGMAALQWSANVSLERESEELSARQMAGVLAGALLFTALIFFATPAVVAGWTEAYLGPFLVHLIEGVVRIGFLLGYLWLIGRMPDVRRLFAYHGAEHKTIHAFEAGVTLDVRNIQSFSPAHPRCGTSFLLIAMVVSIFVFALLGQPPFEWRVLSRIVLLPLIAAVSYEVLRFGATNRGRWFARAMTGPGLALQRLTTREPQDDQVEVAVVAFTTLRETEARAGISNLNVGTLQPEINA